MVEKVTCLWGGKKDQTRGEQQCSKYFFHVRFAKCPDKWFSNCVEWFSMCQATFKVNNKLFMSILLFKSLLHKLVAWGKQNEK